MAQHQRSKVTLAARNIGGIDETEVEFSPGITVLAGRNATNRTSLLQALMAALGSEQVSLKGDAERGRVELSVDGETYTRTLTRANRTVRMDGDPYLDSDATELADLFAFLLESNEARRAVAQSRDLRELIMRPVDTEAIQSEIEQLEGEKQRIDEELAELEEQERRLPNLEQERTRLKRQIEEKREELEEKELEIESADADVDDTRDEQSELDEKLEELQATRSDLEDVRLDIEAEEKSLEALSDERDEVSTELEELSDVPADDIDGINDQIRSLRTQREALDSTVNELQTVIQFNEEMLDGTSSDVAAALHDHSDGNDDSAITDQLLEDGEHVVCWTCGSEVNRQQFESTLERLRELRQEKLSERSAISDDIDELEAEKQDYEEARRRREQLQRRLQETVDEIESRESTLEELRQRRTELQDRVETLEQTVEELEAEEHDELLDLHKEANQLEFELGRLESDLEDVNAEIESIESRLGEREELEDRREQIRADLEELRSRIENVEADAVAQFNEHMAEVLDMLGYENLERIWIERTETEVREGRRKVSKSSFDLHVVRKTDSGTTYEDTIDHLSESEREVTGLIFALAGYLVHDVYETLPFIVLDSLEAIDAKRIATLVEYLETYADYLLVALLPEDANALDSSYQRISDI